MNKNRTAPAILPGLFDFYNWIFVAYTGKSTRLQPGSIYRNSKRTASLLQRVFNTYGNNETGRYKVEALHHDRQ